MAEQVGCFAVRTVEEVNFIYFFFKDESDPFVQEMMMGVQKFTGLYHCII